MTSLDLTRDPGGGMSNPAAAEIDQVARELEVQPDRGLSVEEARSRLTSYGPNKLAGGKKESRWRAFLRQYEDFMQIVLLVAAVINIFATQDVGTSVVLAGLTVFNAVIGLRQEAKAEESVKALSQMMKTVARVRRDGQAIEVNAEELVPGDVVLVEAGNRVPADARVCLAATLEIEEAALTGESLPVGKSTAPVVGDDVPLGDRLCMAYMNTSVTRGRDPHGSPRGGHRTAVHGHPGDRAPQRDRQAAARGRDPGLDLRDLLGQDRHAHLEQDDRSRAGHP